MRAAVFLLAALLLGPAVAWSQDTKPDSTRDSAATQAKPKGGLFGKAKKLAKNKVVRTVAKTAACTMVPGGGQVIAGAIDAAGADNTGEAAQGAAAGATGSSCLPGMGGGVPGAGMSGGLGGAGAAAAMTGAMPGLLGGGADRDAPGAMGYAPASAGTAAPMMDESTIAGCLGLTIEEYRDFSDPTRGQSRPLTKNDMKRQQKLAKKIDQQRYQACMLQQMSAEPVRTQK